MKTLLIVPRPSVGETLESVVQVALMPSLAEGVDLDGYWIGGKWSGLLDGYDPKSNPKNYEVCRCGKHSKCLECGGRGWKLKQWWEWAPYKGDLVPVADLTEDQLARFDEFACPEWVFKHKAPPLEYVRRVYPTYLAVVLAGNR